MIFPRFLRPIIASCNIIWAFWFEIVTCFPLVKENEPLNYLFWFPQISGPLDVNWKFIWAFWLWNWDLFFPGQGKWASYLITLISPDPITPIVNRKVICLLKYEFVIQHHPSQIVFWFTPYRTPRHLEILLLKYVFLIITVMHILLQYFMSSIIIIPCICLMPQKYNNNDAPEPPIPTDNSIPIQYAQENIHTKRPFELILKWHFIS